MISATQAEKLFQRLKALANFPTADDREKAGEVLRAVQQASQSDEHGRLIIEHIIRTEEFFPAPAKVYSAAHEIADPTRPAIPRRCPSCTDLDWVEVYNDGEFRGMKRCSCERGQFLRANDKRLIAESTRVGAVA